MFLYVTCRDEKEAKKISKKLLDEKLIACSNMVQIKSMYLWKGKIENASETLIIAKTSKKNAKSAESMIKKIHTYKVPCIIRIDSKANKEFEIWSNSEMR